MTSGTQRPWGTYPSQRYTPELRVRRLIIRTAKAEAAATRHDINEILLRMGAKPLKR